MAGCLENRIAIVTGGGRGLGRAIALAIAAEGGDVVLAARTEGELREVAAEVEALGRRALPVVCDVAFEPDVRNLIDRTLEAFGRINIVINNAGAVVRGPLVENSVGDWDMVLNSQVRGTFLVTRFALPTLLEQDWGRVITISSMAGRSGVKNRVAYCTAKWGQLGFTAALDEELQGTGVRAHAVCPGPAATRMRAEGFPTEEPESLIQPEDVAVQVINLLTLPPTAYVRTIDIQTGQSIRYR